MHRAAIFGGIAAAAVAVGIVIALMSTPAEKEPVSNFPIKVDFARIIPYENRTDLTSITRGYVMHVRLLYSEEGPPRPFYLLFSPEDNAWGKVTDPQQWVKEGEYSNHGFQVLSSSKDFDLFTEYFPFDSSIIPKEMRLYCPDCEEKWSKPELVWQGVDERITKVKGLIVHEGVQFYDVAFALGNDQIDTLPASGTLEFRITDSLGVTLYENVYRVKDTDFLPANDPIKYLRVPMGGKASYVFKIPTEQIKSSPTGKTMGFAFINFELEDGRVLSGGIKDVPIPIRQ
jgi:hypothetical protein